MSPSLTRFPLLAVTLLAAMTTSHLSSAAELPGRDERSRQVAVLVRIATPVLESGARGTLPIDAPKPGNSRDRHVALEALGRTLAGIAPWLELGPGTDAEGVQRERLIRLAVASITHATDPASPGFLNFSQGGQALVDTAFLSQALLRAPKQLWGNLSESARINTLAALRTTRVHKPGQSNWLLFSAMVETALLEFSGDWNPEPVEYAFQKHMEWYKGDGVYGDGAHFAFDYYNSFVIQPMLLEIAEVLARKGHPLAESLPLIKKRAIRQADILERLISPEGTFPVIGRSACYRFGALQMLSLAALRQELPATTTPGAVRSALAAVIHRMIEAPGTFDEKGWLTIGVFGRQPNLAEGYINVGSVYLCTFGLLQLGLPPEAPFWTEAPAPWTQKRIWSGEDLPADKAIKD